jgi:hypothetical protein
MLCNHIEIILNRPSMMAHACNHSCQEGRDQEDHSLRMAWAKSPRSYLKNNQKRLEAFLSGRALV